MTKTYANSGSNIRPCELEDAEMLAIGRLIRACAEIEDIVGLYLNELAGLDHTISMVVLGRTPASKRLHIAELLSRRRGPDCAERHKAAFGVEAFREIVQCRNTVAHGILLGLTDDGQIAFEVQEVIGVDEANISTVVNAYDRGDFKTLANRAEEAIPRLEESFGLTALRNKRRLLALSAHPKAQNQPKQKAKPVHPPLPSQG